MRLSAENAGYFRDRRALRVFVVVVVALSLPFYMPLIISGSLGVWNGWAVFLLMWAPGLAALISSVTVYHSLRPLGLLGNRYVFAWSAFALSFPVLYALAIYKGLDAISFTDVRMNDAGVAIWTVALAQSVMSAFGEELGWRGLASPLFSRLYGFRKGQLALGLIWYVYHLPPLLFTDYGSSPHPIFGNAMFLVSVVSLSFLLGVARQASNSIWPSTVYHASHNLFFFALFAPMGPKNELVSWLTGEQGAALTVVLFATGWLALIIQRRVSPEATKGS